MFSNDRTELRKVFYDCWKLKQRGQPLDALQQMIADGATSFTEVGPGKVLQGLIKKVDRGMETRSA